MITDESWIIIGDDNHTDVADETSKYFSALSLLERGTSIVGDVANLPDSVLAAVNF